MLREGLLESFDDFGVRYCMPDGPAPAAAAAGPGRPKYTGSNAAMAHRLHQLLLANVMVRRTKGQAGVELPEKSRYKVGGAGGGGLTGEAWAAWRVTHASNSLAAPPLLSTQRTGAHPHSAHHPHPLLPPPGVCGHL
jgi:hypothetical protein